MRMFALNTPRIMKSNIIIVFAALSIISCTLSGPDLTEALDDARTLQDMIPAFAGALSVCDASRGRTFDSTADYVTDEDDKGEPPSHFWTKYSNGSVAICPPTGYYVNFDETGTLAKLELTPDGEDFFHVKLLIYPVLSISVYYELEEYRVQSDWWGMYDADGIYNPLAYEVMETQYFDRRKEVRTVLRKTDEDTDNNTYDVSSGFFDIPDDFSDPGFDFPDMISEPPTVAAAGDDYSSWVESTIPPVLKCWRISTDITEFFVEKDGSKYSKSFVVHNLEGICKVYRTAETVRMWNQDPSENKTVKAKLKSTVGRFNPFNVEVTEDISITGEGENKTFTGIWTTSSEHSKSFEQSITVTETGEDVYEGTLVVSRWNRDVTYDVILDIYGLRIKKGYHQFCSCSKDDFREGKKIEIKFEKGGRFKGHKCGDVFDGEYTYPNGKKIEMVAKHGYIYMCSGDDVLEE
jgi:hypothetical protein